MRKPTLIVISGPTAIGKTSVAIDVALQYDTEIISSDSRQIYREMRIGTAVPSDEQLQAVKHHFVASHSITDTFNASMFEKGVLKLLDNLFVTRKVVVMVGGSGLYIDAVCNGIDDLPAIDADVRSTISKRYAAFGLEPLLDELQRVDPMYFKTVDVRNPKRVMKALEVFYTTGNPYSNYLTYSPKKRPFNVLQLALNRDRAELYDTINKRVVHMVESGLEAEARGLAPYRHLNALNTVGYKEMFDFFDNNISFTEAVESIQQNTRRYAKRQITWFSRTNGQKWFHPENRSEIQHYLDLNL